MILNDQRAEFGPPDKRTHPSDYTLESTATKPMKPKAVEVDDCVVKTLINQHPETMGKRVRVKYDIADNGDTEWFEGIITTYNCMTGKYGVFFPCDGKTEDGITLSDEDVQFID